MAEHCVRARRSWTLGIQVATFQAALQVPFFVAWVRHRGPGLHGCLSYIILLDLRLAVAHPDSIPIHKHSTSTRGSPRATEVRDFH